MTPIDTSAVLAVPRDEIPAVLGELRRVEAILQARLLTPEPPDRLLTASEAAKVLGLSADSLYRRADELPFVVRVGGRVRFSSAGIQRWIAAHGDEL